MDRLLIAKALTESSVGDALKQPEVDKVIANLLAEKSALRALLPRKKGSGQAYIINRRTPTASASRAAWVVDTDTPTEATGTYEQVLFPYKTILAKGKVSRKVQATGASYVDVLADEIEARIEEFRTVEEDAYINANAWETDAKKPLGLIKQLQDAGQVVDGGGQSLSLSMMDELIDKCKGQPSVIVMSKQGRRVLQSKLQTYQRFVDMVEVKAGFRVLSYNGIPVIVSDFVYDNYLVENGNIVGTTDSDADKRMAAFALNFSECFAAELTPVTITPLAKATSQYDEFEIFCDEALVVRDYTTCAALINFKA
jgi:hypothetical protein